MYCTCAPNSSNPWLNHCSTLDMSTATATGGCSTDAPATASHVRPRRPLHSSSTCLTSPLRTGRNAGGGSSGGLCTRGIAHPKRHYSCSEQQLHRETGDASAQQQQQQQHLKEFHPLLYFSQSRASKLRAGCPHQFGIWQPSLAGARRRSGSPQLHSSASQQNLIAPP